MQDSGEQADPLYRAGTRLGIEMEMVVANARSGASACVNHYFSALARIKAAQHTDSVPVYIDGRCTAINTVHAECGLDNGFNLLETALKPVKGGQYGLDRLARAAHHELNDSLLALQDDGLTIWNMSQHPACSTDPHFYNQRVVPRPIYKELVNYRGWMHRAGIDAKAQNGANTAVSVDQAAQALNVVIGLTAASIAIFSNSPFEAGQITGLKENRLTLWPRVFRSARFQGDFELQRFPHRPFHDLADYFNWMFGVGTVSRSLPLSGHGDDYKATDTAILDGDPCLSEFLHARSWGARCLGDSRPVCLKPETRHFVHSQIAAFLDGRFRYSLERLPSLESLLAAWRRDGGLEALFAECGIDGYIEGRAPGANFADSFLLNDAGPEVARSVLVGPSALQLGLLNNLDDALCLVRDWGWMELGQLRETAIRHGLDDARVRALCADVLSVGRGGLSNTDHQWLAYVDYVVTSGSSGADRLLASWHDQKTESVERRLQGMLARHVAIAI